MVPIEYTRDKEREQYELEWGVGEPILRLFGRAQLLTSREDLGLIQQLREHLAGLRTLYKSLSHICAVVLTINAQPVLCLTLKLIF